MHRNKFLHQFAQAWRTWLFVDVVTLWPCADSNLNLAWGRSIVIFSKLSPILWPEPWFSQFSWETLLLNKTQTFVFNCPGIPRVKTFWIFLINYYYSLWANLSKNNTRKYVGRNLLRYIVACRGLVQLVVYY